MSSPEQLEANRRNAQKSTGPTSAEGKATVRLNALWHGAFAQDLLLPGEDGEALTELRESFRTQFAPASQAEEFLVDRMVLAAWRLHRMAHMEVRVLQSAKTSADAHSKMIDAVHDAYVPDRQRSEPDPASIDSIAGAYINACRSNTVSTLNRCQTGIERSFYRALRELQNLRATPGWNARPEPPAESVE